MNFKRSRLLVFAKQPLAGHVKTRLIPAIGVDAATRLHCAMTRRIAQTLTQTALVQWGFAVAGDVNDPLFSDNGATLAPCAQRGIDLGERMANAVDDCFAKSGAGDAVIIVGADCPALEASVVEAALRSLETDSEAVFVPAEDGGYVLIGLRRVIPALFTDMPWGTAAVMALSEARLKEAGVSYTLLAPLWDVDTEADLARLESLSPPLEWRG